jgi:DNA-binding IclR family transcriptional regulator
LEAEVMGKFDEQVFAVLKNSAKPLTLAEIADQMGKPSKTVFKALQKLFSEGKIECDVKNRQYMAVKE